MYTENINESGKIMQILLWLNVLVSVSWTPSLGAMCTSALAERAAKGRGDAGVSPNFCTIHHARAPWCLIGAQYSNMLSAF